MSPILAGSGLLRPVIALNLWTFSMEAWMYALRIPALQKLGGPIKPEESKQRMEQLPPKVRYPADNYNHLFEVNKPGMPLGYQSAC